jgi:hypothetical protein
MTGTVLVGMVITWALAYVAAHMRGRRIGVDRGYRDCKDATAQWESHYRPISPPPTLRYSGKPHLENDCGGCAKYVLVGKNDNPIA